jgi:hypothetical protein
MTTATRTTSEYKSMSAATRRMCIDRPLPTVNGY